MSNVLTVEAKLNGDATGLVGAAGKAAAALKKLEDSAKTASRLGAAFDEVGYKIGVALGTGIRNMATFGLKVIDVTSKVISTLAGLTIKAGLAATAVATVFGTTAIKAGLDRLMSIQDATVALTRMLGSAEAAADLTGKALKVVQGTPFAFPQFAEATRTLVAFGVKAEKVPTVLQAIADSAAASGRGAEAVDGLTQAFANLKVQGKISSDIIQSLGTSGVNALGILANHFGVSTGEAQAMVSDGLIPADEAMDILVKGIEEGSHGIAGDFNALSGAAQDLGKTISGSLGNVKAAFARMGASWLKPFEKDFPDVMNKGVIPLLDKVGEAGQKMTQKIADTGVLQKITEGFQTLIRFVDPAAESFLGIVKSLSPLQVAFDTIKPYLPRMKDDFKGVGELVQTKLIPALGDLIGALMPLLPAFTELLDAGIEGFIEVLPTVVSMIKSLVDIVRPLLGVISDLPGPFLGVIAVLGTLQAMGIPITGMLVKVGTAFVTAATTSTVAATEMGAAATIATGPWGIAIGALALLAGGFLISQQQTKQAIDDVASSLDAATGAYTRNTKELVVSQLTASGAYKAAKELGLGYDTITDAAMGNTEALRLVDEARKRHQDAYDPRNISEEMKVEIGAWADLDAAIGSAASTLEKGTAQDEEHAQKLGLVKDAVLVWRDAYDAASASITTNGATLDVATAAGQANMTALQDVATASIGVTDAMQKEGRSHEDVSSAIRGNRDNLIQMAEKMGVSREEAIKLAEKLLGIPNVDKTVTVNIGGAMANIDILKARLNSIQSRAISVDLNGSVSGNGRPGLAVGGMVESIHHATGAIHAASGRISQMAKGGANITWAEPETGWEAYISGNDLHKNRNKDIWLDAGERLGMFDKKGGDGGGITIINNNYAAPGMSVDEMADRVVNKTRFALGG